MRFTMGCASLVLATALGATPVLAQSGEITVWSWDVAAAALSATVEGFNKQFPDVKVTVEDIGNAQVFDKTLAGCAAGGEGLPDVISVENGEAEIFWSRFPDCFADLKQLGYTDAIAAGFPDFKRTALEVNGAAYAMPWDSGPVTMYYRRDFYEKAGIDPATIKTWDDFIAAGKKLQEANTGVAMVNTDINSSDWFRMLANEQGCGYFSADAQSITISGPGCVTALETFKKIQDAGVAGQADWNQKFTANGAGTVATQMYGGWYEGFIRSSAPDSAGKWGVYDMPSATADGARAANLGGSALAIAATSDNKEAAWAYVNYTLGTVDGQVQMLKTSGLVPSLMAALDDPFVKEPHPFWGDQPIWVDILRTLPRIQPERGTPFFGDADAIFVATLNRYLNNEFPDAKAALDDAANQIAGATGLPIAN
jgi:lactose/L-arabinose transport system substrate-binding protein